MGRILPKATKPTEKMLRMSGFAHERIFEDGRLPVGLKDFGKLKHVIREA